MGFQDLLAKNGGFVGQNMGRGGAILSPNELVLPLWDFFTSLPILVKIDQEMRP